MKHTGGRPGSSSSRWTPPTSLRSSRTPRSCCAAWPRRPARRCESADDEFGYRWLILRDPDFDDLVVSLNTLSTELQGGGYGDRLLAAVFSFEEKGKRIYLIYNFKRGAFYPFVPAPGDKQRDTERELRLKAQLDKELPFEPEITRWFPLWEIPSSRRSSVAGRRCSVLG